MSDNGSSRVTRLYIAAITALALGMFVVSLLGESQSLLPSGNMTALIVPLLVAAAVVAERFRLHLTYQTKVNVEGAILIASALLFDVPTAIAIAATSSLISSLIDRDALDETLFNTSQAALSVGIAGTVFHLLRDMPGLPVVPGLGSLLGVVAGAVTLMLVNTWTVSSVSALDLGTSPLRSWRSSLWLDAPEYAALLIIGVVLASVVLDHPWLIPALLIPIALIHHSLRRSIELRIATRDAVDELALIVDRRDPFMAGHSERVALLVRGFASRLDLSTRDVEIITSAARVHDIGMVAIDPRVVAKPGALSSGEWDELKRHPIVGADLLVRFPQFALAAGAIRHHHERWDGGGYPDRLAGDAIPFAARLIAIVDAFDAMTNPRPYRSAMSVANALAELERGAGTQWDARLVASFVAQMREELVAPEARPIPAPSRLTAAATVAD